MMKRSILILMIASLLIGTVVWARQSDNLDCSQLETSDCRTLTTVLDALPNSSFLARDITIQWDSDSSPRPTAQGPIILDENGVIEALHITYEDDEQVIFADDRVYTRQNEAWTVQEAGSDLLTFMDTALTVIRTSSPRRLDDAESDGQLMHVYESRANAADLLGAHSTLALLTTGLIEALPAGLETNLPAIGGLFTQDTLILRAWVGADDGLLHRLEGEADVDIDLDTFGADPIHLGATFSLWLEQHGEPFTITAPEGVTPSTDGPAFSLDTTLTDIANAANPSRVEATLTLGQPYAGVWQNQEDHYVFEAEAGSIVTITVRAEGGMWNPVLLLLDENGIIAYSDDHQTDATDLSRYDPRIKGLELTTGGRYHILVSGVGHPAADPYEITVEAQ